MKEYKPYLMLIPGSLAVGLGLLVATTSRDVVSTINPLIPLLLAFCGVMIATPNNRGSHTTGLGLVVVSAFLYLRATDVIKLPFLRYAVALLIIILGVKSLIHQWKKLS